MNPTPLAVISSMATKALLTELLAEFQRLHPGRAVALESVGGVDAARRVAAGEALDAVVLGSDAIDQLTASGHVRAGSRVDIVRSGVAIAVRAGAPRPSIPSGSPPCLPSEASHLKIRLHRPWPGAGCWTAPRMIQCACAPCSRRRPGQDGWIWP